MFRNFVFLVIFLVATLNGCSSQTSEKQRIQENPKNVQESVSDDLLILYDKMVLEGRKKIDYYSNEIKYNSNSADLFYREALTEIELNNLREALSECWIYKGSSGHKEVKKYLHLYPVIADRVDLGLGDNIKTAITNHPDCYKIAENNELLNAYQQRVMSTSFEEAHDPIRDLAKAIELNPKLAQAYLYRAKYARIQKQESEDDEMEDYSKELNITPDAKTYIKRALLNYQKDDHLAYSDCLKAISLNPKYSDAYVLKALEEWNNSPECSDSNYNIREACYRKTAETILDDLKTAYLYDPNFPLLKSDIESYGKKMEKDSDFWNFSTANY